MRFQIPVSGEAFAALDFSEAVIDFSFTRVLGSDLNIEIWGITLLTSTRFWPSSLPVPPVPFDGSRDNIYVAGFSNLHLHDVVAGELSLRLFEPQSNPPVFARLHDGREVVLSRRWTAANEDNSLATRSYELHSVLAWPFGECDLVLRAHGHISLD